MAGKQKAAGLILYYSIKIEKTGIPANRNRSSGGTGTGVPVRLEQEFQ